MPTLKDTLRSKLDRIARTKPEPPPQLAELQALFATRRAAQQDLEECLRPVLTLVWRIGDRHGDRYAYHNGEANTALIKLAHLFPEIPEIAELTARHYALREANIELSDKIYTLQANAELATQRHDIADLFLNRLPDLNPLEETTLNDTPTVPAVADEAVSA